MPKRKVRKGKKKQKRVGNSRLIIKSRVNRIYRGRKVVIIPASEIGLNLDQGPNFMRVYKKNDEFIPY